MTVLLYSNTIAVALSGTASLKVHPSTNSAAGIKDSSVTFTVTLVTVLLANATPLPLPVKGSSQYLPSAVISVMVTLSVVKAGTTMSNGLFPCAFTVAVAVPEMLSLTEWLAVLDMVIWSVL